MTATSYHRSGHQLVNNDVPDEIQVSYTKLSSGGPEISEALVMFLTRSEYDRGVNTFSPEGRLFQVEYAIEAVKLGSTSIGIRTSEGVILAAEKRSTSKLMVNDAVEKISKVDQHVGVTFAGLIADSRTLVERAQIEAQNFWFTYNRKIRVEDVTQSVANLALQFGDDDVKASMSRPFGVAMLFAGCDQEGPKLFHLDPSGTFIDCLAKSIGAASDGAEQNLKEQYHESLTLVEAEKIALSILKQVMEEKLTSSNVEIVVIKPTTDDKGRKTGKFERVTKEQLDTLVADL
uniref:Proteasome subunit alpha type n=1 Tax=Steinernema glaseri TaxID=37863 RepID=A0A1I7Z1F1_9BILA